MSSATAYTAREEWTHTVTHGLGALFSIASLILLVIFARSPEALAGAIVFGVTLIATYVVSTLYHATSSERVERKRWMQRLDHCCIYLLIAGTYTPFTLVTVPDVLGGSLFFVVWGLALAGVILKHTPLGYRGWISNASYLGMGWIALFVLEPLVAALPFEGIALLVGGGVAYTLGVIFFVWERLPYHHAIWHLFVMAGSTLHVAAVLFYVV
ncbi:MAG: hemolysin III family protein [Sandaracinus sp.]|jgi:hemolysin III|nr:hemolysin III family protein [Sandaracinus sp.]MCB9614526.1 hemolysin III family protein [Sandaracinus sp.]MCB9622932.1 hemolysin III family protein [Sandaracinus sp.]